MPDIAGMEAAVVAALVDIVTQCAEDLAAQAQGAAPVDTGTLRASIQVEWVHVNGKSITAKVSTGGESSEYAIYQHEGTSRGVPATKFLEGPLIQNAGTYREAMRRAASGAL
jgi:HK97 gp10 family phage protein